MITSWKEMPIGMFQKIYDINGLHISDDEKTFMCVALMAGMEYEDFINLPLDDARSLVAQASFVYGEPKASRTRNEYTINGHKYRLMKDISEMTTAQYIDFQAIVGQQLEYCLPDLMAIVLVPKGKKYNEEYNHNDVVEEIRDHFNVEDALSVANFFTKKFERSMRRMLTFSDSIMTTARIMAPKAEKERLRAMELEMRLLSGEVLSALGSRLSKR